MIFVLHFQLKFVVLSNKHPDEDLQDSWILSIVVLFLGIKIAPEVGKIVSLQRADQTKGGVLLRSDTENYFELGR